MTAWLNRMGGHLWTVLPAARDVLLPLPSGRSKALRAQEVGIMLVDDQYGPTRLSATFRDVPGSTGAVVLVHGLGGRRHAGYVRRAARELQRAGFATLALDLRGADRQGGGIYHVAQVEDLRAACRAPVLRRFENLFVLGFSMGGHVALHFAASDDERRLRAVAAMCTPLDLRSAQQHLDTRASGVYRRYVLRNLRQMYAAVVRRNEVGAVRREILRCQTFREWDRLVIAPRYGYESAEDYYDDLSARHVLPDLRVDTMLLLARNDPIVPPHLALPYIGTAPVGKLRVRVVARGGHLQFPRAQSLSGDGVSASGVVSQLAQRWRGLLDSEPDAIGSRVSLLQPRAL